ncbi:MAG TPA: ABC transporter permease [Anaerolineales bacterium]|jgi:ABC-2 type transport system permease protein
MRILDLALKDLFQILRDRRSLMFLVAMPVAFTLFMGFAYKSGSALSDTRIPLGWVNDDPDGALSKQLHESLAQSEAIKLVELDPAKWEAALQKADVAGVLVIPQGFSTQINTAPVQLKLVAEPASARGQSLFQILRSPITRLMSSVEIARLSNKIIGKPEDGAEWQLAFQAASHAWDESDNATLIKTSLSTRANENFYGDNPYNQASPGILVQFAIFGLVTSGQILMQERKLRTLQRMLTTSMHTWEIVAGHMLAMFSVVFLQEALLVVFGQLVLRVNYAREPLATLLVAAALGLWIASLGLLIGVVVWNDAQVVLFSLLAMFIFSALGGTWFPLEASGGVFASIGRLMPSTWAMAGFQNILLRRLGLESVWLPVAVLLLYALGFFGLAVWRFRTSQE